MSRQAMINPAGAVSSWAKWATPTQSKDLGQRRASEAGTGLWVDALAPLATGRRW